MELRDRRSWLGHTDAGHTGTGRTPEWMRQPRSLGMASKQIRTWASIRHRGRSIGPERGPPGGCEVCGVGRVEQSRLAGGQKLGCSEVMLRCGGDMLPCWRTTHPLNCNRQHWPLGAGNGISSSACACADLGAPRDGAVETTELLAREMTESKPIYSTTSERGCNQEEDMLELDTVWLYILHCRHD